MNTKLETAFAVALALALSAGSAAAGGKPPAVDGANCSTLQGEPYASNACNGYLVELCAAIDLAVLAPRDRDTMVSKVIGAAIKIDQEKFDDAYGKLGEIDAKLDSLLEARKPKIGVEDALAISDDLIPAQMCVLELP